MFFQLSKIAEFFVNPAHLALLLASIGVALLFTRFAKTGRTLATAGVLALLAMSFSPLAIYLALPLENRFARPAADMPAPGGIIVLGGAFDENISMARGGVAFNDSAERLTATVELSRRYPQARILFSGGSSSLRGSPFSEAQVAGRFLEQMGVDPARIILEDKSRNTFENAVYSRELASPRPGEPWLLVTSAMHMPRSVGIFRRVGFPAIPYPVAYHTRGSWMDISLHKNAPEMLRLVDLTAHEWIGLLAYWLTGKTDALFPAPEAGQ
ncbi:YdcF family protein [Methylosinus sp. H3A]|uniref:YdcF family protein n=1 Tax=Methylosinus sp. H3A TaxID=2785786 RepID=UPI0018C28A90|nr:YdcF family protein [Methylosinus sp. H3A]MBG0809814.1 YdcF family protein [Methylosinus sp. H3A]